MKIEYRSRKRSHKLDGIGVGRIRTFPFLPIPFTTLSLMIQWKLGCRSRKQKRKTQPIARPGIEHCQWFILPLLLATPTLQFSLDRKRRSDKQNQSSASDSVGLIFTRSIVSLYASDYDSDYDSVASENQPLCLVGQNEGRGFMRIVSLPFFLELFLFRVECWCWLDTTFF